MLPLQGVLIKIKSDSVQSALLHLRAIEMLGIVIIVDKRESVREKYGTYELEGP